MRPSALLAVTLAGLTTAGCVAAVGGDCESERCTGSDDGGTTNPAAKSCTEANSKVHLGDLRVTSDAQLEDAVDEIEESSGCWSLNGNLTIEGSVTSLAKLKNLVSVNDLQIIGTDLTTIDALQKMEVGGSLLVSGNDALTSLDNLRVKRYTGATDGGEFVVTYTIRDNKELTTATGLRPINRVDGDLAITNNPKLTTLEFSELETIGGLLTITGTAATSLNIAHLKMVDGIDVSSNPALTSVSGLQATTIFGSVKFATNPKLTTIGSMSSLLQISGNLLVDDNDALTNLGALTGSMQRITGSVTITNNALLADLGQLSHLSQGIGSTVTISSNPALATCKAIEVKHCGKAPAGVVFTGNASPPSRESNCDCWCD